MTKFIDIKESYVILQWKERTIEQWNCDAYKKQKIKRKEKVEQEIAKEDNIQQVDE